MAALIFSVILITTPVPDKYICVRWTWTGDVFNRKVYCLEWKKIDDRK
jgi:hypothetical protein